MNFKCLIRTTASDNLDRLDAKRVALHGSKNSFAAVRFPDFLRFSIEQKEY